uniref:Uncharacterized protein n=1 Tax=Tanacetum cinerariifolium TaxID=118510 RepID=A0A6L2LMV3_TANCI|nr:hypothetical protein [Tanacetum cinerariifolium]
MVNMRSKAADESGMLLAMRSRCGRAEDVKNKWVMLEEERIKERKTKVQKYNSLIQMGKVQNQRNEYQLATRMTKLEFPSLDGEGFKDWYYRCNQFFELDEAPENMKIRIVAIHLKGRALEWHQGFMKDMEGKNIKLREQFVDGIVSNPLIEIKNLKLTSSVDDYNSVADGYKIPVQRLGHGIGYTLAFYAPKGVELQALLSSFEDVFRMPKGLPPKRNLDHTITLQQGSNPINLRAYKPSQSEFASPVVLVKKKDVSWRFCVDYKKLNQLTIKNRFPILIVEEFFDKLHGSQFFSKLDLRSGYHQIRMKESDIEKTAFRTHEGLFEFVAKSAFQNLKEAMSHTPVLALPNFEEPFIIETDASGVGLGAVLSQNKHPIAFFSKALGPKHLQLATYEKELLAIVAAIQRWKGYLLGRPFVIKTDHQALKYILEQKECNPTLQKWLSKLLGLQYTVLYQKSNENQVADVFVLTDGKLQALIDVINEQPNGVKKYYLEDGMRMRKGRLVVGDDKELRRELIKFFQASALGRHSGVHATTQRPSPPIHQTQKSIPQRRFLLAYVRPVNAN